MGYTKFGEFMRIQRVKNHEVMADTAPTALEPGRVEQAPISMMSAPSSRSMPIRESAASGS